MIRDVCISHSTLAELELLGARIREVKSEISGRGGLLNVACRSDLIELSLLEAIVRFHSEKKQHSAGLQPAASTILVGRC